MNGFDGIFDEWVEQAIKVVSRVGWEEAPVNALLLLCHSMSAKRDWKLEKWMKGPARWLVGIVGGYLGYLVLSDIFLH